MADFLNTSSTEKCTTGIHTVVQMQAVLSSGEAEVSDSIGILGVFQGGKNA